MSKPALLLHPCSIPQYIVEYSMLFMWAHAEGGSNSADATTWVRASSFTTQWCGSNSADADHYLDALHFQGEA